MGVTAVRKLSKGNYNLLLLIEQGSARSYSQDQLDAAYSDRDENWSERERVAKGFTAAIIAISEIVSSDTEGTLIRSRLKNQTDFYSLAGSINNLQNSKRLPKPEIAATNLKKFLAIVEDPSKRATFPAAEAYYAASRSASNDQGPRQTRINIMQGVIFGELVLP